MVGGADAVKLETVRGAGILVWGSVAQAVNHSMDVVETTVTTRKTADFTIS